MDCKYKSRLVRRFLTLPFHYQFAIMKEFGLLIDDEFLELFKQVNHKNLLAKLWDETEKYHEDSADFNPFKEEGN